MALSDEILADSPVAYWRQTPNANGTVGNVATDVSGNGNHLEVWNDGGSGATYPRQATSLDASSANPSIDIVPGSNIWESAVRAALQMSAAVTLTFLTKPRSAVIDGGAGIGPYHDVVRHGGNYGIITDNNGSGQSIWRAEFDISGVGVNQLSGPLVDLGVIVHLGFTFNNGLARLYINGSIAASNDYGPNSLGGGGTFTIGQQGANGQGYDGLVDEVAVWNTALSPTRIAAQSNAAFGGGGTDILTGGADIVTGGADIVSGASDEL